MSEAVGYFAWRRAVDAGAAPCVRDDHIEWTYAEFAYRVEAFAAQLAERGVAPGDVVAIMLPNRVELLVAMMAAWRVGAAATLVNPAFTEQEAGYQIADADAVLVVDAGSGAPAAGRPTVSVATMSSVVPAGWQPPAEPDANAVALLIYTSGSAGRPKGVQLTHANLQYMSSAMARHLALTSADHCVLILPLFHVNAICVSFLAPILAGGQLSITGHFSARRFFDDVARLRPTYFSAVPTIYAVLAAQPDEVVADCSSLRFAICGAAPISKELLARIEHRLGWTVVEGYGLTEGTCATTCNPVDGVRKLGTVGPALPGQAIAILDEAGTPLPAGAAGEVAVKGPNVMRGYLNRPQETARTVAGGWLRTGDVGVLDADGYLTLVDRIKDMIIRGGENIYPKEIENALAGDPGVLEAAVIGVPDEVYGEVPVAYVVTYPESVVTPNELADHLRTRLTKVKLPVAIHLVDALPRNPVGKIDKPGLRAQHAQQVSAG